MTNLDQILNLKQRIGAAVIGQETVVEQLLIALLANGPPADGRFAGPGQDAHHQDVAKNLES